MPQYLGLDSSTQSLSALLIDTDTGKVVAERSVNFGERLPQYKSPKGFLANEDASIKHSDPLMWVEALELVLQDLRSAGVDLGRVRGISGAGQQHGSVYLSKSLDRSATGPCRRRFASKFGRCSRVRPRPSGWTARPAPNAPKSPAPRAATSAWPPSLGRAPPCASPVRRSVASTRPARPSGSAPPRSTWSALSWPSLLVGKSVSIDLGDGAGMNLLDLAKS
jgi:xylulokinase